MVVIVLVVMILILSILFFLLLMMLCMLCCLVKGSLLCFKPWVNLIRLLVHRLGLFLILRLRFIRVLVSGNDAASSRSCFISSHKSNGASDE